MQKVIKNEYEFIVPEVVKKATDSYKISNNSFLQFYNECCCERLGERIQDNCTVKRFFDVYVAWCKDNNRGYFESKKDIKKTLQKMNIADIKTKGGYDCFSKFTLKNEVKRDYVSIYGNDGGMSKPEWCA